ncbi:MAG: 4-hydroxythreonine-4-phosphate dehydrogenase PdxA [Candidatus Omnitrophota bacterium]|nr:4-hydroxythreonine-4-phosphate dehydrogenase PdxA [Candidatus Omnitrophota bacterium]
MKEIVISSGDPVGCGPRITLEAIANLSAQPFDFFVVGDKVIFERVPGYTALRNRFDLIDMKTPGIRRLRSGYPTKLSGHASLRYLAGALQLLDRQRMFRLVTAPLSKEAVQLYMPRFIGHTEYLARYFGVKNAQMLMMSGKLKIILFTRHCALRKVSALITREALCLALRQVRQELIKLFNINRPRIVVASFNPHAGINTFLEREETIVRDAIHKSACGATGPFPADTLFLHRNINRYDCIVCLYHDQAMIPFKLLSFRDGVNVTLGLPVIRTSPAHGTAFDLVRQRIAPSWTSMAQAIKIAARLSL